MIYDMVDQLTDKVRDLDVKLSYITDIVDKIFNAISRGEGTSSSTGASSSTAGAGPSKDTVAPSTVQGSRKRRA